MRKQTRRKIWPLVNPVAFAIEGAAIPPKEELDKLRLRELSSLDAFTRGLAGLQEWSDLKAMLNLAEAMAQLGVGKDEVMPACHAAQAALIDAARRYERTGKMGLTGHGLQALRELYAYHDAQRSSVARSVYEQAIKRATNRVRGKAPEVVEI